MFCRMQCLWLDFHLTYLSPDLKFVRFKKKKKNMKYLVKSICLLSSFPILPIIFKIRQNKHILFFLTDKYSTYTPWKMFVPPQ